MKSLTLFISLCTVLISLQGCTNQGAGGAYPREVIASPAEKLSAGSGAMHTGMSN